MKQIVVDNQVTDYFITSDGKCWSNKTHSFLKGQLSNSGYLNYNLTLPDGTKRRLYAHRLVAQNYVDNPKDKREVNHINGDKLDNRAENLEWVTHTENHIHALQKELRKYPHVYCFNAEHELIYEYINAAEAARQTNVSLCLVNQEIHAKEKSCIKGYYFSLSPSLGKVYQHENSGVAKKVLCYKDGELFKTFPSANAAARWLGVKSHSHIGECCRGKIKSYKGYVWKYANDIV